jgi:hypothetical protein
MDVTLSLIANQGLGELGCGVNLGSSTPPSRTTRPPGLTWGSVHSRGLRFPTEAKREAALRLAGAYVELITVAVGTGLRFGEASALWVSEVDLPVRGRFRRGPSGSEHADLVVHRFFTRGPSSRDGPFPTPVMHRRGGGALSLRILMRIRSIAAVIAPAALILAGHPVVASAATTTAMTCFGHRATIVGHPRGEVIRGTSHADVIVARGGDDTVYGGGGNDLICAGDGGDHVYGGRGADRISAGRGADTVSGGDGADVEFGNSGDDVVSGNADDDVLSGGADDDQVNGGLGDDELDGDRGDDVLHGDDGNDVLDDDQGENLEQGDQGDDDCQSTSSAACDDEDSDDDSAGGDDQ